MELSTLSVRVNNEDKKGFEKFCTNTGMNVSTAINMFIKAVLREQKLPFEIKSDVFEKDIYYKLLEAEKEIDNNSRRYSTDEIIESMNRIID